MTENFNNLISNLSSSNFKDNTHVLALEDLKINLQRSISICEKSSDRLDISSQGEEQEYWFLILEQLYKMDHTVRDKSVDSRRVYFEEVIKSLSKDIIELLEKMCSYVSIQAIITV